LYAQISEQGNQWTVYWNDEQEVPYAVNGNQWVGFDNPRSLRLKVNIFLNNLLTSETPLTLCLTTCCFLLDKTIFIHESLTMDLFFLQQKHKEQVCLTLNVWAAKNLSTGLGL
jgi:hypothetical protein